MNPLSGLVTGAALILAAASAAARPGDAAQFIQRAPAPMLAMINWNEYLRDVVRKRAKKKPRK